MDALEAKRVIEGMLFVTGEPVSLKRLKEVLDEMDHAAVRQLLTQLNDDYVQTQRALRVQEVAGGYQLVTDPALAPWMQRALALPREALLSHAALETLAIVAYRQPITKAEIEVIRGVDVTGTLERLTERQFVRVAGRKETPGRPILYGTTVEFLRHFGLKSLGDLPPMKNETATPTLPLVAPMQNASEAVASEPADAVPPAVMEVSDTQHAT
ncbi:MAG: SMC-Scp complex subunit ScpB [Candidatus Omnitrophica bacterium]|nr:SMC-Scp complex subunit ScpB [Candidatus Omnitrophota bacterium]